MERRTVNSRRRALPVVRWLQVGAAAAGVGMALAAAPSIASADDGGAVAGATQVGHRGSQSGSVAARQTNSDRRGPATRGASAASPLGVVARQNATAAAGPRPVPASALARSVVPTPAPAATSHTSVRTAAAAVASNASTARAVGAPAPAPAAQANPLGQVAAFLGLPGAPSTSAPSLGVVPELLALTVQDLITGTGAPTVTNPTAVVTGLFNQILRTNPTTDELNNYLGVLNVTGVNGVVAGLLSSTEFKQALINNYYLEMLNRPAGMAELALESSALMWGFPEPLIAVGIASSNEFYQASSAGGTTFGVAPTPETYVRALYRSLLGQKADPTQLASYVQNIASGQPLFFAATQFVTSDAFRLTKLNEIYSVLGQTPTQQELVNYTQNWVREGGLFGIAAGLLATSGNVQRIESGQVVLPDMTNAALLQQLLLAPYTDAETGFVPLYRQLVGDCSDTSAPACVNPALYSLITTGGNDRGILNNSVENNSIVTNVGALIPTQNEIDLSKSLFFPLTNPTTLAAYMVSTPITPFGGPIVTADSGAYIVDGHHRWSSIYLINPGAKLNAQDLGYVPTPQDALMQSQMAIAAYQGVLGSSTAGNQNVYNISQTDFNNYVATTINGGGQSAQIYTLFANYLGYSSGLSQADQLARIQTYLWNNVLQMRTNNPFIPNAPGRPVMPQFEGDDPSGPYNKDIMKIYPGQTVIYTFPIISFLG